jgi:hypothetical protein
MADTNVAKTENSTQSLKDIAHLQSSTEISNDRTYVQAGELGFEESTSGGLGRHLGTFSTIFLM